MGGHLPTYWGGCSIPSPTLVMIIKWNGKPTSLPNVAGGPPPHLMGKPSNRSPNGMGGHPPTQIEWAAHLCIDIMFYVSICLQYMFRIIYNTLYIIYYVFYLIYAIFYRIYVIYLILYVVYNLVAYIQGIYGILYITN